MKQKKARENENERERAVGGVFSSVEDYGQSQRRVSEIERAELELSSESFQIDRIAIAAAGRGPWSRGACPPSAQSTNETRLKERLRDQQLWG